MKKGSIFVLAGLASLGIAACFSKPVYAAQAFSSTKGSQAVLWQGPVVWRAETGPIKGSSSSDGGGDTGGGGGGGCSLTKSLEVNNTDAVQLVREAFEIWKGVPNSSLDIQEGPSLGTDVNFDNIENFYVGEFNVGGQKVGSNASPAGCYDSDPNTECLNSVIFDNSNVPERSLVDAIQGQCARFSILAFAGILPKQDAQGAITDPVLKSAQMVISGACVSPVIAPDPNCDFPATPDNEGACPAGGITMQELKGTIVHEVGHFLGLDHTLVNKQNYIDCQTGTGSCDLENIPTMIGLFVPGADLSTLHYDDKVSFAKYYPSSTTTVSGVEVIPGTCTLAGKVFRSNGTTQQRCMEVVAKLDNNPATSTGMVSGAEVPRNSVLTQIQETGNDPNGANNDCSDPANCSNFEFRGLTPGNYTIGVQNFNDNGKGTGLADFVLEPCHPALTASSNLDNPSALTNVSCVAGGAVTNLVVKAN